MGRIALITVVSLLAPAAASAQTAQPEAALAKTDSVANTQADNGGFSDIVVTAQRRSDSLQHVPLAVSALTGSSLTRSPVSSLIDVQTAIPNINISARTSSGVVSIRGIGFDIVTAGADGSVALHSDGVYQSRPTAALAGLYDIERIEVARGPQGTLYGRNATGGAINIISHKPSEDLEGYLSASYGNYSAYNVQGAVGGALVPGILTARIAAKAEAHDGYSINVFDGSHVDDLRDYAARAEFDLHPEGTFSFLLIGDYYRRNDHSFPTHFGGCIAVVCGPNAGVSRGFPVPADIRDVDVDAGPVNRQTLGGVSLTTTAQLGGVDLKAISAYRTGATYFVFDFDGTALPGSFATREEDHHELSQEVQLNHKGTKLDWLIGAYVFHERNFARTNGHFPLYLTAAGFSDFFQGGVLKTTAYAGFGELNWHATPRLTFTVGGRYSIESKHLIGEYTYTNGPRNMIARQAAPTAAIPCVTCLGLPDSTKFRSFTPKFAASYQIDSDRLVYVSAQKGFKSGGFSVGSVTPAFNPEKIWSYEAGLKASWFERRVITNIAVYHYNYSDLQVGQVIGVASVISNAGKVQVDGVEAEVRAKLSGRLQIFAQGAYNHARFTSYQSANPALGNGVILNLAGNSLSNAPRKTGDLGAEYSAPVATGTVSLRGDVYMSSRVFFSPWNDIINSQAAYDLENLSLRYDSHGKKWFAGLYVNNLRNRTIKSGSFTSTALTGGFVNVQLQPPRTFGVNAGYNF